MRREFDADTDFSGYGRTLAIDHVAPRAPRVHGHAESVALLAKHGAGDAVDALLSGMRAGRHEMVLVTVHAPLGVRLTHYIHSSTLGIQSGLHGIRAGGIRRHGPETPGSEVAQDGLNLSRAMSYKCAAAELPYGGSKTTVQTEPIAVDDDHRLGFIAWCIDRGNLITGPDVGFAPELIDRLAARFTRHIQCGPSGPLGSTGSPTAEGVFAAIRAAAAHLWGSSNLDGKRASVQGLGAVGLELSERLAAAGMTVVGADPDPTRVEAARARVPGIEIVAPERILSLSTDLLAPCALGAVLNEATIAKLDCKLIYGSANNQLAANSVDDEIALAERIAARGILTQPDWSITAGGVIAGHEEYTHRAAAHMDRVHATIARVCGAKNAELLSAAQAKNVTPTRLAYDRVLPLVHPCRNS